MVAYIKNSKKLFQPKNVEVVGCQLFTLKSNQYLFNYIYKGKEVLVTFARNSDDYQELTLIHPEKIFGTFAYMQPVQI